MSGDKSLVNLKLVTFNQGVTTSPDITSAYKISSNEKIVIKKARGFYDFDLFEPNIQKRFSETGYSVPDLDVYQILGGVVSGNYALVCSGMLMDTSMREMPENLSGSFLNSSAYLTQKGTKKYLYKQDYGDLVLHKQPAMLLASSGDHIYHHWLFDVCSKLYVWDKILNKSVRLAIPTTIKPYQLEFYYDLGITDKNILFFDSQFNNQFEELYISPSFSQADWIFPVAFHYLRKLVFDAFKINEWESKPSLNIIVTRSDVKNNIRQLLNEKRLVSIAENYGLTAHSSGSLSIRQQVKIFSQMGDCAVIHGSGGANLLFANHEMKCVHLHPDCVGTFRAHGRINAVLGNEYSYVFGSSFARKERLHNNPWYVREESFRTAMHELY